MADLERVRVLEMHEERLEKPVFYRDLRVLEMGELPNFSLMRAVTFDDLVISGCPLASEVLFHELVHVTQYRLLGIDRFASLYVRGFLAGGSYDQIPLEVCAYSLGERYPHEGQPFDVESEVVQWIESGRSA